MSHNKIPTASFKQENYLDYINHIFLKFNLKIIKSLLFNGFALKLVINKRSDKFFRLFRVFCFICCSLCYFSCFSFPYPRFFTIFAVEFFSAKMNTYFYCANNKFYREKSPAFDLNRAIKYGDGLFESIRIIEGKMINLSMHFERLQAGMRFLQFEIHHEQMEEMKICMNQLLIKNEIDQGGRMRLTVYRNGGGKYSPDTNRLSYFIEAENLPEKRFILNSRGLSIETATENCIYYHPLLRFKTLNALPYILASIEKDQKLVDELLLLNQAGRLVEGTASNLFLTFGNNLYTAELSEGCLDGVMRKLMLQLAKEMGMKTHIDQLPVEYLNRADEVFLTNSIVGLRWVGSYRKKRYFNKWSRKLTDALNQRFTA